MKVGICILKKDQKNEKCCVVVLCTVGGTLTLNLNNPMYKSENKGLEVDMVREKRIGGLDDYRV